MKATTMKLKHFPKKLVRGINGVNIGSGTGWSMGCFYVVVNLLNGTSDLTLSPPQVQVKCDPMFLKVPTD